MQKCEAHLSLRSPCTSSVGSVCVSVTPSGKTTVGDGTADKTPASGLKNKVETASLLYLSSSLPLFAPAPPQPNNPFWA